MRSMVKFSAAALVLLALAGCDYAYKSRPMSQVQSIQPTGTDFNAALARNYKALSEVERVQGDNRDADTYARRAEAAARGNPTQPDDPALRQYIRPQHQGEITNARARLMSAFSAGFKTSAPERAARAQACYDCWLEQLDEFADLQVDHIAACKACFEAALVVPASKFIVFFDFDKYAITPEAQRILQQAAAAARDQKASAVLLAGHTDTSGSAQYNLGLSARRADAVKEAMASLGIPTSAINTQALGETMPLVPTGDGVREPQNRRVEISFR